MLENRKSQSMCTNNPDTDYWPDLCLEHGFLTEGTCKLRATATNSSIKGYRDVWRSPEMFDVLHVRKHWNAMYFVVVECYYICLLVSIRGVRMNFVSRYEHLLWLFLSAHMPVIIRTHCTLLAITIELMGQANYWLISIRIFCKKASMHCCTLFNFMQIYAMVSRVSFHPLSETV